MSTITWWVFAITFIIWGWGMVSARKRRSPWYKDLLYTIALWGGFALMFVSPESLPKSLFRTRAGSLGILIGGTLLLGSEFLAKRKFLGFSLLAAGMVLVYFAFFADPLYSYPLFAIGFLLIGVSFFVAYLRKSREKGT